MLGFGSLQNLSLTSDLIFQLNFGVAGGIFKLLKNLHCYMEECSSKIYFDNCINFLHGHLTAPHTNGRPGHFPHPGPVPQGPQCAAGCTKIPPCAPTAQHCTLRKTLPNTKLYLEALLWNIPTAFQHPKCIRLCWTVVWIATSIF